MANTLRIKRRLSTGAAGAPTGLLEGELAVNFADKKLYIQGDNGILTMPDKDYVDTAITSATGSLGTMSTQNADAVAITGGAIDGTTVGATTASSGAFTTLTASSAPVNSDDVVRKTELDAVSSSVSALGSAFNYVGTVAGGVDAASAMPLSALAEKDAGDYYKVATAGYFVLAPASAFYANANDGLVFNNASGVDVIDNTNSSVSGTANEIAVTGSTDTGFTVAIDSVFSGRLSTAETDITDLETKTQNISLALTSAGFTSIDGTVSVVAGLGGEDVQITPNSIFSLGNPGDFTIGTNATAGKIIIDSNGGASAIDLNGSVTNVANHIAVANWLMSNYGTSSGVGMGSGPNGNFVSVEDSGDATFKADLTGIILGSQYAGATPSSLNVQCRLNLLGVDDPNNNAKMNIDNFVIDGGVF